MLSSVQILERKGVSYRLIALSDRALSVQDVIRFSKGDVNIWEICKTIILRDEDEGKYAFFLAGSDKIDFSKAERGIGKRLKMVNADEVRIFAGLDPGAVCPLLLTAPIFIDKRVLKLDKVNFGSGDHRYGLEIATNDFLKIIPHTVMDITKNLR
jgi:prolyl-tRNA editing enzyme YbaK/EbsC (Cys-tRNA(Pro) deacylase)